MVNKIPLNGQTEFSLAREGKEPIHFKGFKVYEAFAKELNPYFPFRTMRIYVANDEDMILSITEGKETNNHYPVYTFKAEDLDGILNQVSRDCPRYLTPSFEIFKSLYKDLEKAKQRGDF